MTPEQVQKLIAKLNARAVDHDEFAKTVGGPMRDFAWISSVTVALTLREVARMIEETTV